MPEKWYLPTEGRGVIDCLENLSFILSFLSESIAKETHEVCFSEDSTAGLYHLLSFIQESLDQCVQVLLGKEV